MCKRPQYVQPTRWELYPSLKRTQVTVRDLVSVFHIRLLPWAEHYPPRCTVRPRSQTGVRKKSLWYEHPQCSTLASTHSAVRSSPVFYPSQVKTFCSKILPSHYRLESTHSGRVLSGAVEWRWCRRCPRSGHPVWVHSVRLSFLQPPTRITSGAL